MTEPATIALTIHITAPGQDARHHAQTIADLITAEHGHHMRLRIAITDPDYTPPPPGSDRDALPDELRALIAPQMPLYLSTACETARACGLAAEAFPDHADELRTWEQREHAACRITRKQDMAKCECDCHGPADAAPPPCDTCGHPKGSHPTGGFCSALVYREACGCDDYEPPEPPGAAPVRIAATTDQPPDRP